ncbi:ankyrin repeat domain-containing protein [Wolbachia endosymbiont of Ctenocephalides felis wCfeJ]|uniref:ankyrin repeat domain-containing protein n=1 Tax=Wolbachia endosymbiont of Ctenocephalides felis wCfeJ TaxID=2732594 RepID=UPI0014482CC5|nr:ankyrin repeat domain-containing protein [Wolbachia endosymbiont of Ctenocephalides felis wCfeJ]WCR58441.1 MAG: Chromosome partition protein Smc [Wolbachia endosymbiont of Ctenocephalides felis wCfeJ]
MSNLDESTKKLFGAIDAENLEDFKQALAEGADVNAFDDGYTPLMTIIISNNNSPICLKMMMLLLQHQDLNVNIQEPKENNTALHLAFRMENRNFVQILFTHPNLNSDIKNDYNDCYGMNRSYTPKEYVEQIGREQRKDFSHLTVETQKAQKGKQLLDALAGKSIYQAKMLLSQKLNPNCWERNKNGEIETPLSLIIKSCLQIVTRNKEEVLTKLLKHKELDFSQMKPIQAIEQNPRLKQIIKQAMTEQLTDAINSKDLDDVKKLVEDNRFMNYAIVVVALKDVGDPIKSIKNYLNEKFPASVEQSLADMNDTPVGFEEFVQELVDELEKAKAQLAEKERELNSIKRAKLNQQTRMSVLTDQVIQLTREKSQLENLRDELERTKAHLAKKEQELDTIIHKEANSARDLNQEKQEKRIRTLTNQVNQLTKENAQLRAQNQNFKNKKSSEASAPGKRQSNHASVFFILSGAFTVGACLTIPDLEICIPLAVVALGLFLIGCYLLCKKNEQDIGPSGITDNPRIKMVLASSPSSSENFYTC